MLRLRPLAVSAVLLLVVPSTARAEPQTGAARGKAFWSALAKDCAVPPGETATMEMLPAVDAVIFSNTRS